MKIPYFTVTRRLAMVAALILLPSFALAQSLTWTGGVSGINSSWATANNWSPSGTPISTSDLVFATLVNTTFPTLLLGQDWTIRSITANNATGQFSASNGLRIASTTSTSSNAARNLTFGTAGTIVTATDNANISFRSASLSGTSTASPLPKLTVNLGYTGQGVIDVKDTSIVLFAEGSQNTEGAVIIGTGGITKTGIGTLRLNDSHTYTGNFVLQQGTVIITGSGGQTGGIIDSTPFGKGTVYLTGGNLSANTATSTRNLFNPVVLGGNVEFFKNATSGVLTITTTADGTTTLSANSTINNEGTLLWNQSISGGFGITKTGGGVLALNGANTYTGATTVSAGTLSINGSTASGSAVTVASGGTLSGSGTVGGATTVQSGGILAPGNSPGLMTFSDGLTLDNGSITNFEINGTTRGTTYDAINLTSGLMTYGGTFNLSFGDAIANGSVLSLFALSGSGSAGAFSSIAATGSYTGSFTNDSGVWSLTSNEQVLSFSQSTGNLSFAAIPEPSTYAVIFGALALVGVMVRRRRRAAS